MPFMFGWDQAKGIFGLTDDPSDYVTDASEANDSVVEVAITTFQEATKVLTDQLAVTSAENADRLELLYKYRDAVSQAYVYLLDNKPDKAKDQLAKVVNK